MKNLWKTKKSQIPSTLTWVVAFLIIFFIMILFIASTSILAYRKTIKIEQGVYSADEVSLTRSLIRILDTPASDGQTVKELIKKWDISDGEEEQNIKEIIKREFDLALEKYSFRIRGVDHSANLVFDKNPGEVSNKDDYKFSTIYLVSDKGVLQVSLSFDMYQEVGGLL